MKYFKPFLFFLITSIALLTSCNSSKKMLETGNYYQAVMQSVEKLQSSPDNKKAREVLAQAYPLAVDDFLDKIRNTRAVQSEFSNSHAVSMYDNINRMYEKIQQSPAAKSVINNPKKYYKEVAKLKSLAAEEQYQAGMTEFEQGNRESYKRAYFYFIDANKYVENYKDVASLIEDSFNLSILKVITDLKPVQSRMYDLSADVFYNEVQKTFRQIEQNEFIRFFTLEEAEEMDIKNPDQLLQINFDDFIVGETHTKERVEKMKSDTVKVGEIKLDRGGKKDVYDVVFAEVSINRMEVISKGIIHLNVTEPNFGNKALLNEDFSGQYVWFNEWGNYNGDKRALTDEQFAICKQKNIPPIPPQQMFVEFTRPIHTNLSNRLRNFYKGY